jgi:hypothetical protein
MSQLKGRKWHVQRAVAIRGEGLYEGLDWYSPTLSLALNTKHLQKLIWLQSNFTNCVGLHHRHFGLADSIRQGPVKNQFVIDLIVFN